MCVCVQQLSGPLTGGATTDGTGLKDENSSDGHVGSSENVQAGGAAGAAGAAGASDLGAGTGSQTQAAAAFGSRGNSVLKQRFYLTADNLDAITSHLFDGSDLEV